MSFLDFILDHVLTQTDHNDEQRGWKLVYGGYCMMIGENNYGSCTKQYGDICVPFLRVSVTLYIYVQEA